MACPGPRAGAPRVLAEDFIVGTREALRTGVDGWLDDDMAFVTPWGFDLDEVHVPVTLWQGSENLMVPQAHGRWLAAHLPRVHPHLEEGEGHISVSVGHIDDMLDELLSLANA